MLLNLTDNVDVTSSDGIYSDSKSISVYPNPIVENAELMFLAKHSEVVKINVLTIDGRKVSTFSQSVLEGKNVFKLFLPKGTYFVNIVGSDYTYTIKTISLSNYNSQSKITNSCPERQKINQSNTTDLLVRMKYSTNDQLLFKFYSGNYCSVVCDVPASNKILDTEFVECKDANGKYYSTVKIGSQIWMAENLDYIPEAASDFSVGLEDEQEWMTKSTPYYYVYDRARYGVIYNWYASIAAVPEGWHLPTDSEWTELSNLLGGESVSGGKLKSTSGWEIPNTDGVNSVGFTALPGGARAVDVYFGQGLATGWWSSTIDVSENIFGRSVNNTSGGLNRISNYGYFGFSVRCVKD